MDSGSGSMQSSSGGDEEYDSQFIPPPPPQQPSFTFHNILPPPPQIPFNNFQTLPTSFPDFSSSYIFNNPDANPLILNPDPAPAVTQNQAPLRSGPSSSAGLHPKVSSKKRTRASRRAPTTVLTTDTSNFRAMVQEFTGIPSPPFAPAGSSSSYSRRFDLFSSAIRSTAGANLDPPGSAFCPPRSKIQQPETMQKVQQIPGGIFSPPSVSVSGHDFSSKEIITGTANCKMNFSGSSSNKEIMGNIISSTRGESTVESWICPSD